MPAFFPRASIQRAPIQRDAVAHGRAPVRRSLRLAFSLSAIALLAAGNASAQTNTDHIADLLQTPGSAGLGFISRIEASPYIDAGNRRDLIPLYLYEGERFSLNADRAAIKLVNTEEHRFDAFLGRRLEGFPEDDIPESLEGMEARNTTIDLGMV